MRGMMSAIETSQAASGIARHDKDRKTHYIPDYLRLVARKSRAGFDKVHEELTKIYSSEKKMQRRNTEISSPIASAGQPETKQAKSPTSPTQATRRNQKEPKESKESKRMSLRKQWARSTKTNTLWMSTGSVLPTTGSFISYIEELDDELCVPKQRLEADLLKKELDLTRQHSDQTGLVSTDKVTTKSLSANQVRKDKSIFTFDKPHISKSFDSISDSVDSPNDIEQDAGSEYVNIGDVALHLPTNPDIVKESHESTYDVPKLSIKPPIKPRKHIFKPVNKSDVNLINDTEMNIAESSKRKYPPGDQNLEQNIADDDYLQMDNVVRQDSTDDRSKEKNNETIKTLEDSLGGSDDYVLPDMCPQQTTDRSYTQLEENNNNENIYAMIQKKSEISENIDGKEEVIYANSTSAVYDDFDLLRENNIFSDDSGDIYQVPPTHLKSSVDETGPFDIVLDSNGAKKEFYDFSVQEVVSCLNACALPHLASVCEEEQLDGQFFRNFDDKQLLQAPFVLNWFHLAKLRKVISGWRPRR